MEVDDDFQPQASGPVNRGIDVLCCALYVGCAESFVGPETDRDANNVEAGVGDFLEVVPRDKVVPVVSKYTRCLIGVLLPEGKFIDDVIVKWSEY
jgi:hypothetical protein